MEEKSLKLNQETMDVLVANVIPTTKYFESQFNHMQYQINEIKENNQKFEIHVDKQFSEVKENQKKFEEQVDKRFEQIDKRFEQVDKRFGQIENSIVNLTLEIKDLSKTIDVSVRDYIIERDRHYDAKFNNLRLFNIAIIIGVSGIILKMINII